MLSHFGSRESGLDVSWDVFFFGGGGCFFFLGISVVGCPGLCGIVSNSLSLSGLHPPDAQNPSPLPHPSSPVVTPKMSPDIAQYLGGNEGGAACLRLLVYPQKIAQQAGEVIL